MQEMLVELYGPLLQSLDNPATALVMLAYLDAGTGSMVFQWIVAGLLGGAFMFKTSWRRLAAMFSRKKSSAD